MNTQNKKQDWWHKWVVIGFYGLILAIILLNGTFGKGSGDGIDQPFFADRFDWSPADIIGLIVFAAGLAWIGGFADLISNKAGKGDVYQYGKRKDENKNLAVGIILPLIGLLIIWFL